MKQVKLSFDLTLAALIHAEFRLSTCSDQFEVQENLPLLMNDVGFLVVSTRATHVVQYLVLPHMVPLNLDIT